MSSTNDPVWTIHEFAGINNVSAAEELKREDLTHALNVDLTNRKRLRQRPGYSVVDNRPVHSLGGSEDLGLYVAGGDLLAIDETGATSVVRVGLKDPDASMYYAEDAQGVLYTNGVDYGCVTPSGEDIGWGAEPLPYGGLTIATTAGGLRPGTYRIAATTVDARGRESAPTELYTQRLDTEGGFSVSFPTPSGLTDYVRIYMTHTDGQELYLAAQTGAGASSALVVAPATGKLLRTVGASPIPKQGIPAVYNGRLYVLQSDVLWYSEAYNYDICYLNRNFVVPTGRALMLLPTASGLVVCTDHGIATLTGSNPKDFVWQDVSAAYSIPGTQARVPSEHFGEDAVAGSHVWVWLTDRGAMAADASNRVMPLTKGRVVFGKHERGAAAFSHSNSTSAYRAVTKGPDQGSGLSIVDRATAEVYRNGVLITQ